MRKDISPKRGLVSRFGMLALGASLAIGTTVSAQEQSEQEQSAEETQEVTVTGYRAALRSALQTKRQSGVMVDAINSDDIADFPDANLAESLQRIPGISIDRDQGEGRTISVRGLGPEFTRVRINGLEALSTAGGNEAGTSPNRSRSFDFNTFASELFSSLKVQKTSSAETDEGSLGATVDLVTGRPFDFKSFQMGFSAEDSFYENGGFHNPKLAGLASWHNESLGALISVAYSERQTEVDQYRRQAGSPDFLYRQSDFASNENPQRGGFAAPAGSVLAGYTNPRAVQLQTGSDLAAYMRLYPGAPYNTPGRLDDSTVRIPALASVEQSDVAYNRLGITNSYQWKPDDTTTVNLDLLYSKYDYASVISQVSTVGLNRNNTLAAFNTASTTLTPTQRRATFPTATLCTFNDGLGTNPPQDCGQAIYGTTPVAGYQFSFNPKNLDVWEYYNNPMSPGVLTDSSGRGLAGRDLIIGRPAVRVMDSNVTNGVADYLVLENIDMRSAADAQFYTTEFKQASLNVDKEVSDNFHASFTYGRSVSRNDSDGQLVEFNSMDSPGQFVYDERGHGDMPVISFGFNAADPENWGIIKGFSGMRHFKRFVENEYDGGRLDLNWQMSDKLNLLFGASSRQYSFSTQQRERNNDILNPTEREAGVTVESLGHLVEFGDSLDVPAGTLSTFWAPDLDKFNDVFGFLCDCVNEFGDFRAIRRNAGREDFSVNERDNSVFVQLNFDTEVFGRRAFGNVGVREAFTNLVSTGNTSTSGGLPLQAENSYSDFLPSMNLAYEVVDSVLVRLGAAKVMARPQLGNLSPTITAFNIPVAGPPTMTIGNPYLKPFRGVNYDFSVEWYFNDEGGLLSAAYFLKDIDSFPQTVLVEGPLSQFLTAEGIAAVRQGFAAGSPAQAYITNDGVFSTRQFRDAPGGELSGYELSYQQDLSFLPGFLKNLGIQLNYTNIESELNYILDPGNGTTVPQRTGTGPWLNASPEAINFTLYYETEKFSIRGSAAHRTEYFTTYPIAGGVCNPGIDVAPANATPATAVTYCNTPLINDFSGSEKTLNVDASASWNVTDNFTVLAEALNLTDQTTNRWSYVNSPVVTQYGSAGRQFTLGARYRY